MYVCMYVSGMYVFMYQVCMYLCIRDVCMYDVCSLIIMSVYDLIVEGLRQCNVMKEIISGCNKRAGVC